MKRAITLRNIPPAVEKAIRAKALERKISANRAVIELLEERLGVAGRKRVLHHDLDALAGTWSEEDAKEFDEALREIRQIDPEIWKGAVSCSTRRRENESEFALRRRVGMIPSPAAR